MNDTKGVLQNQLEVPSTWKTQIFVAWMYAGKN